MTTPFASMRRRPNPKRAAGLVATALCAVLCATLAGCGGAAATPSAADVSSASPSNTYTTLTSNFRNVDLGCGWEPTGSMELTHARCFTVDYFEGGFALACMADGNRYLVVPEGATAPAGLSADIQVVQQPVRDVYLAASDTMCLFDALGCVDRISVSGIERDDWTIASARAAMDAGTIVFGGKYRAPDYELLLERGVSLAVESTMINHVPEVREKLMELGISVLTELSSYEEEPLGRTEWIRLYGLLCNEDERAQQVFDEQVAKVSTLQSEDTGKTVAFFYLNANGSAIVRRPGDYVTKMIAQAGGHYVFTNVGAAQAGSSTLTMEMEQFYATAKDADVVIYNASIDDGMDSLKKLVQKNGLLADFAAVRNGNVWVCDQNMYQHMVATGDIIQDFNRVFCGATEDQTYVRRLT